MASVEFVAEAARVLRAVFADVCLVADRRMLRGRRYGNRVLAAAHHPDRLPAGRLAARVAQDPLPGRVLHEASLDAFVASTRPGLPQALPRKCAEHGTCTRILVHA